MEADGATIHQVGMSRQPWHPANLRALLRLPSLASSIDASVIHGHSSVGGALARLAGRRAGLPVVYTANGVATGAAYQRIERALGRLTSVWVAVSDSEASMAERGGLAGGGPIIVVPNGIELAPAGPATIDLRDRLRVGPSAPLVGTVARLVPQKSPLTFVRTAARVAAAHPDAHFLLIGMGPLQASVDAEVARHAGLAKHWHQIEHIDNAAAVLGQLDVFVLVSAFEGAPYTPLEAMRAGVPVVVTDVVGSRDAVEDGVSGLVRPAGDSGALAAAVLQLLGDPALGDRLAAAATERLADRFDVDDMGRRVAAAYETALRRRPA
jgi:glycosyltransferase involved in cell wall biosynthesis